MQPGHIYFLSLALIVMPLLPFSRTAIVVGLAWLVGQVPHLSGLDLGDLDLVVPLVACAAAWLLAANDRDRAIGILYLPTFAIHVSAAAGQTTAYDAWWLDWSFAMARVFVLPFTVDLTGLREVYAAFKRRKEWDDLTWRRVLCWQFG